MTGMQWGKIPDTKAGSCLLRKRTDPDSPERTFLFRIAANAARLRSAAFAVY